ncbi:MAG: DHA2 family efflux MFS transporter permease subunit [Actinomycetota bacterium]|nr:DHA2 family efflux MFS transporter permease subunit [Actinomycetota bacterium]
MGGPPAGVPAESSTAWKTLALTSLAVLATFLDTTILFVAFADIGASFPDIGAAQLSWVLNAYTITFAALLVPVGKLADRVGHKRAFLVGSALFTVASMACGLAPSAWALVAFRIVQAVGAATLLPSSLALVLRAFPRERLPMAVAIWGAAGALAGAIGPSLGAAVVELGGWRWVFFLNLPVGMVTVLAGIRILSESREPTARVPAPLGVVLVASAAALVSLGVVQSDIWGWADGRTIGAIGAGVVVLGLFVAHQRTTPAPALDLELFSIRNFRWATAATMAFGTAFTAMFFGSFLFLTQVWGWSTLRGGLGVSPGPLLVGVLAPQMGRLASRIGQRPMIIAGGFAYAVGGVLRLVMLDAQPDYVADYLPSLLFTGLGVALCLPQLASTTAQAIPATRLGVGSGVNQAVRQFGGTLGVALTIALLSSAASPELALAAFDRVWWLIVAGGLLTSLLAVPLRTAVAGVVPPPVVAPGGPVVAPVE